MFGYTWPESSNNVNDTNIYEYNLTTNYWTVVKAKNASLSKRAYHYSAILNDSMIILYGITLEDSSPLYDIWKFNFTTSEWSFLLNIENQSNKIPSGNGAYVMIGSTLYILFGRTLNAVMNSIYYIDFSKENLLINIVANNQYSPARRINHCSVIINDIMFIIGGLSNSGTYLYDVWRFYLSDYTWSCDISTGNFPSGRELFSCVVVSNLIIIFGGRDATTIYNDFHLYDTAARTWSSFVSTTSISARHSMCLAVYSFYTIIIGGTNDLAVFNEIWAFNYLLNEYSLINTNDAVKFALTNVNCWVDTKNSTNNIYVIGGRTANYKPDNNIYKIQIIEFGNSLKTNTSILLNAKNEVASESPIVVDGNLVYVLFGSTWDEIMFSTVLVINYVTQDEYTLDFSSKIMLFGHSAIFYQDSIYIFGGGYSAGSIKLSHSTSNQLYKFNTNINDLVHLGCSPGTISPNCTPCPAGTYFNNSDCLPCPIGKFSTSIASTNPRQCIPCDYGYYSNETGATYCRDCSSYIYCPIGSSAPLNNSVNIPSYKSTQPQIYSGQTNYVSSLISQLWYANFGLSFAILILILSIKSFWKNVYKLDVFVDKHDQKVNKSVIYRETDIGGIFSIFAVLGVSVIIISALLSFQLDNITEIKSLVPMIIIDTPISASKLSVIAIFYLYGGLCVNKGSICMTGNNVIDSGFNYKNKVVKCQWLNRNCVVNIQFSDVSIETSSTINIQMSEITAAAAGIVIWINSSSSIPSEVSSIFVSISPDSSNKIFAGTLATIVKFDFTSSVIII